MMYKSITGLKTKNIFSWFKFWLMTIQAFRGAQKAKGFIEYFTKMHNEYKDKTIQFIRLVAKKKFSAFAYLSKMA